MPLLIIALPLVPGCALAAWLLWRRRATLAQAVPTIVQGGVQIPLNLLVVRSGGILGGVQRNSMRPRLVIGNEGLRFQAITSQHWVFATIAHVEARPRRSGWKLVFVRLDRKAVLVADILGEHNAVAALRALPRSLALTPQAAVLRDGEGAAGKTGLHLYRGPLR